MEAFRTLNSRFAASKQTGRGGFQSCFGFLRVFAFRLVNCTVLGWIQCTCDIPCSETCHSLHPSHPSISTLHETHARPMPCTTDARPRPEKRSQVCPSSPWTLSVIPTSGRTSRSIRRCRRSGKVVPRESSFFFLVCVCVFYLKRQGSWGTCTIVERLESSTSVRGAGSGCMRRLQKTMLVCEGDVRTQVLDGCRQRCRVQMKHSERYSSFALEPKHKHRSIIKSSSTLRTQTL